MRIDPAVSRRLESEYGTGLRGIASYQQETIEYHYLRNDIESGYSREEFETMLKELILEGIAREYLESLFHAGRLEATIYAFQGAIIFHFVIDEVSGFVVSIDRDADVDFEWVVATVEAGIPLGSESSTPS